jgi:hypothetical protein
VPAVHLDRTCLRELANIRAGDKALFAPGQHNGAHAIISYNALEEFRQPFADLTVEGVFGLGPVNAYDGDCVIADVQIHDWRLSTHIHLFLLFRQAKSDTELSINHKDPSECL